MLLEICSFQKHAVFFRVSHKGWRGGRYIWYSTVCILCFVGYKCMCVCFVGGDLESLILQVTIVSLAAFEITLC